MQKYKSNCNTFPKQEWKEIPYNDDDDLSSNLNDMLLISEDITNNKYPDVETENLPINDIPLCTQFYTNMESISLKTQLLAHQKEAIEWLEKRENVEVGRNSGGILADDMGLGKTLDCIAIMIRSLDSCLKSTIVNTEACISRTDHFLMLNLVVVPFSLLSQWKYEILQHTNAPESSIIIYHGSHRKESLNSLINCGNGFIVITTYEIIRQEYSEEMKLRSTVPRRPKKNFSKSSPLFNYTWYRVFLDEAHRIRTHSNITTQAVCYLVSKRRWCITGTPFNNKIDDLISLSKFIDIPPYNNLHWWNIHRSNDSARNSWVEMFVLNRRKDILNLPTQTSVIINVEFQEEEYAFYLNVFSDALNQYLRFKNTVGVKRFKMFGTVLSWLIRLRQVCDHPLLLLGRAWTRPYAEQSSAGMFYAKEICCKCKESADDIGYLNNLDCGHYVCQFCTTTERKCNMCKQLAPWLGSESLLPIQENTNQSEQCRYFLRNKQSESTKRGSSIKNKYKINSKCTAILNFCKEKLSESDSNNKIVIFSQWTGFLDLLEYFFKEGGLVFLRYDGDITKIESRTEILKEFTIPDKYKIILCSLQCGGLGLNLTMANIAILADSWYNPFLEKQAVDRVHRIGQTKPVTVVRFIVNKSIEMDVAKIQERKKVAAWNILSRIGMQKSGNLNQSEENYGTQKNNVCGICETDVHEIFKKASTVFSIRKNMTTSENPICNTAIPKRQLENESISQTNAKKKRNVFNYFKQH